MIFWNLIAEHEANERVKCGCCADKKEEKKESSKEELLKRRRERCFYLMKSSFDWVFFSHAPIFLHLKDLECQRVECQLVQGFDVCTHNLGDGYRPVLIRFLDEELDLVTIPLSIDEAVKIMKFMSEGE